MIKFSVAYYYQNGARIGTVNYNDYKDLTNDAIKVRHVNLNTQIQVSKHVDGVCVGMWQI